MFEPINLDACDAGDTQQIADVLYLLAEYAQRKAWAQRYRVQGNIEHAQHHEGKNEALYQRLPEWARW